MLAMVVRDRKAADRDWMRGVIGAGEGRSAGIEGHRYGKDLEDRPQFVNTESVPIEHPISERNSWMTRIGRRRVVRVEIGQRGHAQNFAGIDVHDQSSAALCGEIVDDA